MTNIDGHNPGHEWNQLTGLEIRLRLITIDHRGLDPDMGTISAKLGKGPVH